MIYFIKKRRRITNARAWIMHHSRILPGEIIIEGYFRALKDELKIKNWKWANHRIKRLLSLPGGRLQKPRSTCSKAPEENCHLGKVTLIKCLGCFCSQLSSQGLQQCLVYHLRSALYICHTQKITRCVTNEQAAQKIGEDACSSPVAHGHSFSANQTSINCYPSLSFLFRTSLLTAITSPIKCQESVENTYLCQETRL